MERIRDEAHLQGFWAHRLAMFQVGNVTAGTLKMKNCFFFGSKNAINISYKEIDFETVYEKGE